MRRNRFLSFSLIFLVCTVFLFSCGKKESVQKSSFGRVDPLTDGQVLIDRNDNPAVMTRSKSPEKESAPEDSLIKTAKQLDVDDLPDEIKRLAGLCDAINMTCVEQRKLYDEKDNDFVWHCVHVFANSYNDPELGFSQVGDTVDANPDVVLKVLYAMFGKIDAVPDLSNAKEDEGEPHITISTDLHYRFSMGDRGMSEPSIKRVTSYSDGSMEMEVALVDSETGQEIVDFVYTFRSNTRDATTDALFGYEITDVHPADKLTADKMNGRPFLTAAVQVYGYDEDPANEEVEEILTFTAFKDHVPGMDELNKRISSELIDALSNELPKGTYHCIRSYPISITDYIQFAATIDTYPAVQSGSDIKTYNYDIKKQRAMDESDALAFFEMSEDELMQEIVNVWNTLNPDESATAAAYKGFIVRVDGSADVFANITVQNADGAKIIAFNSSSRTIRDTQEYVIPENEEDKMLPPLSHGRKE